MIESVVGEGDELCNQCNDVVSCRGANTSDVPTRRSSRHGIELQECGAFHDVCASSSANASEAVAAGRSALISVHDGTIHVRCCPPPSLVTMWLDLSGSS